MDGDPPGEASAPGVQALRKAMALLGFVADSAAPPRFTDLLERSSLPKGTLHRMLAALIETGMLRFDPGSETYRLGVRLFELAHRVWDEFDLRGAAEPELQRLAGLTGEATRLSILDGTDVLTIDQRGGRAQSVRLGGGIGGRTALHASGTGKAILAHLPAADRLRLIGERTLPALTPRTLTDPALLTRELDLCAGRGYAVSIDEQTQGVSSVAAAVLDHQARPLGAIAVVGPSFRLNEASLHALGRDVMEAARRTSGNAGQVAMSMTTARRPLGPDRPDVTVAFPGTSFLAEGPWWCADGMLRWVDILAPALLQGDPASGAVRTTPMPDLTSAIVPRSKGGFVLATQSGFRAWDGETATMLAQPEPDLPGNRLNDAACDRMGRLWAGTLAIDTTPGNGALWRLDPGGAMHRMDHGFHVANGLGWSPDDRTMYFVDSGRRRIYAYAFDLATGTLGARRNFVDVPEGAGVPDGLAVDADGFVWVAHWDGWCVTRYDPDGRVERVVNLPVPRPTSCTFGGPGLDCLYITTGRIRLSAQQLADAPLSGSVLAFHPGICGLPAASFAG